MLNNRMKKNQVILFIVTVAVLVGLNKFVLSQNPVVIEHSPAEMVNHEHVSSQKLFNDV